MGVHATFCGQPPLTSKLVVHMAFSPHSKPRRFEADIRKRPLAQTSETRMDQPFVSVHTGLSLLSEVLSSFVLSDWSSAPATGSDGILSAPSTTSVIALDCAGLESENVTLQIAFLSYPQGMDEYKIAPHSLHFLRHTSQKPDFFRLASLSFSYCSTLSRKPQHEWRTQIQAKIKT